MTNPTVTAWAPKTEGKTLEEIEQERYGRTVPVPADVPADR